MSQLCPYCHRRNISVHAHRLDLALVRLQPSPKATDEEGCFHLVRALHGSISEPWVYRDNRGLLVDITQLSIASLLYLPELTRLTRSIRDVATVQTASIGRSLREKLERLIWSRRRDQSDAQAILWAVERNLKYLGQRRRYWIERDGQALASLYATSHVDARNLASQTLGLGLDDFTIWPYL